MLVKLRVIRWFLLYFTMIPVLVNVLILCMSMTCLLNTRTRSMSMRIPWEPIFSRIQERRLSIRDCLCRHISIRKKSTVMGMGFTMIRS